MRLPLTKEIIVSTINQGNYILYKKEHLKKDSIPEHIFEEKGKNLIISSGEAQLF